MEEHSGESITDFSKSKSLPCDVSQVSTKKKLPIYHSLIITDVDLEKPLPCDASQVHTLLFSLTDKQCNEECFIEFARVVKFFTINKFPNLKSLVLNNVYLNDELLECFQKYKFEYFHLWYFSFCDKIDKISVKYKKHLKKFKTLSIKELRIDVSLRLMFPNIQVEIPSNMKILILRIDSKGSSPNDDSNRGSILFNAKETKCLLIVRFFCDPSFRGRISYCPPIVACNKEFICHVLRNQMTFHARVDSIWGHNVVKLCMDENLLEDTSTTFPECSFCVVTISHSSTYYGNIQICSNRCRCDPLDILLTQCSEALYG